MAAADSADSPWLRHSTIAVAKLVVASSRAPVQPCAAPSSISSSGNAWASAPVISSCSTQVGHHLPGTVDGRLQRLEPELGAPQVGARHLGPAGPGGVGRRPAAVRRPGHDAAGPVLDPLRVVGQPAVQRHGEPGRRVTVDHPGVGAGDHGDLVAVPGTEHHVDAVAGQHVGGLVERVQPHEPGQGVGCGAVRQVDPDGAGHRGPRPDHVVAVLGEPAADHLLQQRVDEEPGAGARPCRTPAGTPRWSGGPSPRAPG